MRSQKQLTMENFFLLALALTILGWVSLNFLPVLPHWIGWVLIGAGAFTFLGGVVAG